MNVLVRADASPLMGTGHAMRCIALAQELVARGDGVALAASSLTEGVRARLDAEAIEVREIGAEPGSPGDLEATLTVAAEAGAEWLVVDGYAFDAAYYRAAREHGLRVLAVDDYVHAERYDVDLLLNQNVYAAPEMYRARVADARLLLGPAYALLRSEFRAEADRPRLIPRRARRLLVTLGGTQAAAALEGSLEAIARVPASDLEVRVVVPALATIDVRGAADPRVRLLESPQDMPAELAWADVAIGAGGTTALEFAFMGLPVLLFVLADNQRRVVEALVDWGVGIAAGEPSAVSPENLEDALRALLDDQDARVKMARRGRRLVDGEGARRVVDALRGDAVALRPATWGDRELLWEWANDPETRRASFSREQIPWDRHLEWLRARLDAPDSRLLVAADAAGAPVGQVRFDFAGPEATISVSIAPQSRGRGLGSRTIASACDDLLGRGEVDVVHAYIRPENAASVAAFRRARFEVEGAAPMAEAEALHLTRRARGGVELERG